MSPPPPPPPPHQQQQRSDNYADISHDLIASKFPHILPEAQLGQRLPSLEAFRQATQHHAVNKTKEYSLVVVTESSPQQRILLGTKHRGFGEGMNNSFGGKLHPTQETIVQCACRELEEETGITVSEDYMAQCFVGAMHFTFQDGDLQMIVRVYHVDVATSDTISNNSQTNDNCNNNDNLSSYLIDPACIRGCEEITPAWIDNWFDLPLNNMFADDSLWITRLLWAFSLGEALNIDGWFHFHPGGQHTNAIQYYYMNIRHKRKIKEKKTASHNNVPLTLEKRLFHALHSNQIHSPSIKEFKEAFAFCNAVRSNFKKQSFQVIVDVAGGHGALAALLLITTSATKGIVIDPAQVGNNGVQRAWGKDFLQRKDNNKQLEYRHEDLRTGLPEVLQEVSQTVPREDILVVACHACQHLSEEILEIVCTKFRGVHAAVMPCCQNDRTGSWKSTSKNLGIPIAKVMDLLLAGKVMSWPTKQGDSSSNRKFDYDVRMKLIDESITPQNRIILCRAIHHSNNVETKTLAVQKQKSLEAAHQKLAATYSKAHETPKKCSAKKKAVDSWTNPYSLSSSYGLAGAYLAVGFLVGLLVGRNATFKR
mgnify:CR=1 FL=1